MREKVYVCKKCGYVLLKRDAVVSGWDSEGSSTHVHCPGCGKIIARYVEQERRNRLELDRIDKVLFVLPFLTLADTVSTEFSLMFGGGEGGPIAGPVYERYGQFGLVALSIFAFLRCWVACGFSDMRKGELSKRSCLSQTELF